MPIKDGNQSDTIYESGDSMAIYCAPIIRLNVVKLIAFPFINLAYSCACVFIASARAAQQTCTVP